MPVRGSKRCWDRGLNISLYHVRICWCIGTYSSARYFPGSLNLNSDRLDIRTTRRSDDPGDRFQYYMTGREIASLEQHSPNSFSNVTMNINSPSSLLMKSTFGVEWRLAEGHKNVRENQMAKGPSPAYLEPRYTCPLG